MAGNVFGNPVTDDVVKLIYPNEEVTPQLRAKVAFQDMTADDRNVNCQNFVHNLKTDYGKGNSVLCMIFNWNGDTLTYVNNKDWHGSVWKSSAPAKIQNGQWGGFLYVHSTLHGSEGAVVYRGNNGDGVGCEWLLAWDNPLSGGNRVSSSSLTSYYLFYFELPYNVISHNFIKFMTVLQVIRI